MANKVTITMNDVPAGLDSMYVRVEEDALTAGVRNVLHSGVQAVTGNTIDIDIGENGAVGNGAIISADNYTSGGAAFKSMTGYALIEAVDTPPSGLWLEGERLKFIAFGDSITDQGDTRLDLQGTGNYTKSIRGYWVNGFNSCNQDIQVLNGVGVSNDQTLDLLNRMDDVLLSGADVVVLMIGTNDRTQGRTVEEITVSMADILDQIIAAGMKVILMPVTHRGGDMTPDFNLSIDDLNASYQTLANERSDDVVMCGDPTDFNALVVSEPSEVTSDNLHPNPYGAWLIGNPLATTINANVLSTTPVGDVNYAPPFDGNSGQLLDGATGEVFDNWRLYYANPADGVGGTINGDGSITVSTGVNTGGNENKSSLTNGNPTTGYLIVPEGDYIFSINFSISDIRKVKSGEILIRDNTGLSSVFSLDEDSDSVTTNKLVLDNDRVIINKLNIPAGRKIQILINIDSKDTEQLEYTVSNPELRKVG